MSTRTSTDLGAPGGAEFISFSPGETPRWQKFDHSSSTKQFSRYAYSRVMPRSRFSPWDEYAESQMRHNLQEEEYSEIPGDRVVDVGGDVATVRQAFTMNFADRSPIEAVDTFSSLEQQPVGRSSR
jgi:hypothetical protein